MLAGLADFLYLCSANEKERFTYRSVGTGRGGDGGDAAGCLFGDEICP